VGQDEELVLEAEQIGDVHKESGPPSQEAAQLDSAPLQNGLLASDGGQLSLVQGADGLSLFALGIAQGWRRYA